MMRRSDDDDRAILAAADAWPEIPTLADIDRRSLINLSRRRGTDFATAVLYDRLRNSPVHGSLLRELGGDAVSQEHSADVARAAWVVVPGAFHRERPETGADGSLLRAQAARLGIPFEVVPTESFGSLAANAAIVKEHLRRRTKGSFVLISLSKGSLEVRHLLAETDAADVLESATAWINLTGPLSGSSLVGWLRRRPWRAWGLRAAFWWRGYDFNVIRELGCERHASSWQLPRGLPAVHVVGFPLRRHLTSALMRRGHRRLADQGPSDGAGLLLADVLDWPGVVYPVWGADHYLRTSDDDLSTLVLRVLHYLDRCRTPAVATGSLS